MTSFDWQRLLRQWYEVPGYPDVFVLGSFARYVTLYSQQVRALNLIAGLCETGLISEDSELAIVGGGVAGTTAAAAAALKKAKVTLIEETDHLLPIQRNNRQRWLHPHIYNWPNHHEGDATRLPVLPWHADYSHNVAEALLTEFREISKGASIDCRTGAEAVHVKSDYPPRLIWNDRQRGHQCKAFRGIILAVGFGLEQRKDYSHSYWEEDDIDSSISRSDERWLISGFGDGALTDLMRLCIRNFRHADLRSMFSAAPGIEGVKGDLARIHSDPRALDPKWLSSEFADFPGIEELTSFIRPNLEDRLRTGVKVYLAGKTLDMYDPGASILNRLIVRLLADFNAFRLLHGPVDKIERIEQGHGVQYRVQLGGSGERVFDRVLLRHGPICKLRRDFPLIWKACKDPRTRWKQSTPGKDLTSRRLWSPGLFGPEVKIPAGASKEMPEHNARRERLQVEADALSLFVEIRDDGSCQILYQIDGLRVLKGNIRQIGFKFGSTLGQIGPVEMDELARQNKVTWQPERLPLNSETAPGTNDLDPLEKAKSRARTLSGTFELGELLAPRENQDERDNAVSFGFRFSIANAYALSEWEFDQFYAENGTYINGDKLPGKIEYAGQFVYLPIKTLTVRLTLPNRSPGPASVSVFLCPGREDISESDIRQGDKLLTSLPANSPHSPDKRGSLAWKKVSDLRDVQPFSFDNRTIQTYELRKESPPVGSFFSLEWRLEPGSTPPEFESVEADAKAYRKELLDLRSELQRGATTEIAKKASELFQNLQARLEEMYAPGDEVDGFEISFFTYDEDGAEKDGQSRVLRLVDGRFGGKPPTDSDWKFSLPFGVGLAGACFKHGGRFVYSRAAAEDSSSASRSPDYYVRLRPGKHHEFLVSLSLDHRGFSETLAKKVGLERSRQCIGVINIGSIHKQSRLELLLKDGSGAARFKRLVEDSRKFGSKLYEALRAG